jgi:hypothetical protein
MNISPTALAVIVALSSLAGVFITSVFNLLNTRISKASEERRHQRETIVTAAIENWKQATTIALASPDPEKIYPLDAYIIHMIKFTELLVDQNVDPSQVTAKLAELNALMDRVHDWLDRRAQAD